MFAIGTSDLSLISHVACRVTIRTLYGTNLVMIFQKTIQQLACVCVLFAATTSVLVASEPTDSQFQIEFLDGTILTSTFTEPKLMWTDVSEFGEMKKRSIDVSKILSLTLAEEPALSLIHISEPTRPY